MLLNKASTDWLGTKPVYYNEKTGAISHNVNEVIDYANLEIHPEGLKNYLKFGYTVFGQTMVKNVRVLEHSSTIEKDEKGLLTITKNEDMAQKLWNPGRTNSTEVFESIVEAVRQQVAKADNNVIIPLSGGLDSRFIAYAISGNKDIHCYCYGLSARQRDSFETVKSQSVAEKCDLNWKHIELDEFLREEYLDTWYDLYGPSVHLHGMYQMEFYRKIFADLSLPVSYDFGANTGYHVFSGLGGDTFGGAVRVAPINGVNDLTNLGHLHGICITDDICTMKSDEENAGRFFEENRNKFADKNHCALMMIRLKMMLLSYLLRTPESMGATPWSPFLVPELSMSMMNLDWSLKDGRNWLESEFAKYDLKIGWEKKKCDYNMVLDIETLRKNPVKPLDVKLLSPYIRKDYLEKVNREIVRKPMKTIPAKPRTIQNIYNKAVKKYNTDIDAAIIQYEILGTVERLLKRAENNNA